MRRKRWLGLSATLLSLFLGYVAFLNVGKSFVESDSIYQQQLAEKKAAIVSVDENVDLTEDLVVVGDKTLTGTGTLNLNGTITVTRGATLTVDDTVTVNTNEEKPGIIVEKGANVVLDGTVLTNCTYGIKNYGTVEVKNVTISDCTGQGFYNEGIVKGEGLIVKNISGTDANGIYNDGGKMTLTDVEVDSICGNGIYNNGGRLNAKNISVSNITTQNGILNTADGIMNIRRDIIVTNVSGTTEEAGQGNGICIESGEIEVKGNVSVTNITTSGDNDIVSNNAITGQGGLYVKKNITIDNVTAGRGIAMRKTGVVEGTDIVVNNVAATGIYLAAATGKNICNVTASNVTLTNIGENGVHLTEHAGNSFIVTEKLSVSSLNDGSGIVNQGGRMDMRLLDVSNVQGKDSAIENYGSMNVRGASVNITNITSDKDCLYNAGTFRTTTNCTMTISGINGSLSNGIQNVAEGTMKLGKVVVEGATAHGIKNAAIMNVGTIVTVNCGENGINNNGNLTITKCASLRESAKHGIYNGQVLDGKNITIENAGDIMFNNGGEATVDGFVITGTANKAIYNSNYAELYKVTVDGTSIINMSGGVEKTRSEQRLVDNNGGILDLTDTTIKNAYAMAIANRGAANTSVTNVVIDGAGDYGAYVEGSARLSGNGLEINNVVKGVTGAEGIPIKNAGNILVLDHVTIGEDDPEVTGSGVETSEELQALVNNAIINDATTAIYSGYDLEVANATTVLGVYNKGTVFLTDCKIDNANYGLACRYAGWAYLAGDITMTNIMYNPIRTFGVENNLTNGVTLASGTNFHAENMGGHGINNKGSFLATADSNITIKNVKGTNVNAINNNTGTMSLGNVTIDGVYVTVSGTTTNAGSALVTNSSTTLNGIMNISNIYTTGYSYNSNSSGIVVKTSSTTQGSLKGNGSIIIRGNEAGTVDGVEYATGMYNGVFAQKSSIELAGDITVDTVKNNGIYVADANAYVKAKNVSVKNVANGHGVYVNNATGKFITTGNYVADNINRGLFSISSGEITVDGNVTITNPKNVGIEVKGKITVGGNVSVDMNNLNKYAIYLDAGTMKATNVVVKNTANTAIYMENSSVLEAVDVTIENSQNHGLQVQRKGTLTITGTMTAKNIAVNALRVYNDARNKPEIKINKLVAVDVGNYAVAANASIASTNLTITTLQHKNCTNLVHGNVQAGCVGTIEEITE